MYYRYINKNNTLRKKKEMKKKFSNELFGYYNHVKRNELMEVLNNIPQNKIFNEYNHGYPNLINMNNKEWVKKPLKY